MTLNFIYEIPWKTGTLFSFKNPKHLIDVSGYEEVIMPQIPEIVQILKDNALSRQAIINVNSRHLNNFNSCLLYIQFQQTFSQNDKILHVTANYRSQCRVSGRPQDEEMLLYITDNVQRLLGRDFSNIYITVIVNNYHFNTLI